MERIFRQRFIGHNLKFDLSFLYYHYGIDEVTPYGDTMVEAWLLNPSGKFSLDHLSEKFLNYTMKPFKDVVKKGEDFSSTDISIATLYPCEDALITYILHFKLNSILIDSLKGLAKDVEFPFINILIGMET